MHFSLSEFNALSEIEATVVINPVIDSTRTYQQQPEPETSKPKLKLFSLTHESFRDSELKRVGWKRPESAPPVTCAKTSFWVDKKTGEIFTQKQVRKYGITIGPSKSLRMILVQSIIQSCPPSKRDFVRYILKLRNTRGGLIIDLKSALDRWITCENPNMHSTDRARKRKTLEQFLYKKEILANNQTFAKDLQFIADSTKTDYVGEESNLARAFPVIGKPGHGFPSSPLTDSEFREWEQSWTNSRPIVEAMPPSEAMVNSEDGVNGSGTIDR